jgi:hypothetical protein
MALPMSVLREELARFTEGVARQLTMPAALALLADPNANGAVTEVPSSTGTGALTYRWEVLCEEEVEGKPTVRILTHVCDDRPRGQLGSAWTPLCGGGWLFADGTFLQHEMGNLAADQERSGDA